MSLTELIMAHPLTSFELKRINNGIKLTIRKEANGQVYSKQATVVSEDHIVRMLKDMLKEVYEAVKRDKQTPIYSG